MAHSQFRLRRRRDESDGSHLWLCGDEVSDAAEDFTDLSSQALRLWPRTLTSWLQLAVVLSCGTFILALTLLILFWPMLWWALAVLYVLVGAVVLVLFVAFGVYAVRRRKALAALFREQESGDQPSTAIPSDA